VKLRDRVALPVSRDDGHVDKEVRTTFLRARVAAGPHRELVFAVVVPWCGVDVVRQALDPDGSVAGRLHHVEFLEVPATERWIAFVAGKEADPAVPALRHGHVALPRSFDAKVEVGASHAARSIGR